MLALCQHNTLAYYAFYYAGIFDAGLVNNELLIRYTVLLYSNSTIIQLIKFINLFYFQ